jgi:HEAT repeat protein
MLPHRNIPRLASSETSIMSTASFLIRLNQVDSSYLILLSVAGVVIAAAILLYTGLLGWILGGLSHVVRGSIRRGFLLWERLFAWLSWPLFLALVLGLLAVGWAAAGSLSVLTVVCALATLFMGLTACLAYMFIDLERYEVERGHKAVHNPLKGQKQALHLVRYGQQVGGPLLAAAMVGMIGGFALLNQGLYETIGRGWYAVREEQVSPVYVDFLANALIHLLRIVDVLNLARSNQLLQVTYVRQAAWPASLLLAAFQTFFAFVLLQQIFASIRQGNLLAETITDFWSPHESIHERARNALTQYGTRAVWPLLASLRSVASLTREQRVELPPILAAFGPAVIPALVRHLHDPQEHMRALAAAALGHLQTRDEVPLLVDLAHDPSDVVRQSLVEALGLIGAAGADRDRTRRWRFRALQLPAGWMRRWFQRKRPPGPTPLTDPIELAILTLRDALADDSAAVRTQAARALGRIGFPAAEAAPGLVALLKDADETVRCEAAESLGKVRGSEEAAVNALVELLQDAAPSVKASAARALGTLKKAAAPAALALVPLLQDQEESVRTAAAEAIAQVGSLNEAVTDRLVEGLDSPDNVVRAQTAESLGTIGAPAQEAASALVEALADSNGGVRAKAVQALGKIGAGAADVAVPSLVRALRDQDNWVSALAAEALGQMGDSADEAVPALIRSLRHINPQVRGNAAKSLGKMGAAAARARLALETACRDGDGGVRGQAIRALGAVGCPTPASALAVRAGLQDPDSQVRAAAVESVGQWGEANETTLSDLRPLLEDANDQVKVEVIEVLPRLAGATQAVIDGLCRRLLEDDSDWVQIHAALALGKFGPAAAAAGGALLRAAQTGEVGVREQAMRAIAKIQPPETLAAFTAGLEDANGDIRKVASGGWMNAASIPEGVIPVLVRALRDPEVQVQANAAHALARLDSLPAEAIPLLVACTADPSDGLRINAAMALKEVPGSAARAAMQHLVEDANVRIRLIAAGSLLGADPGDARAGAVVVKALSDPALRVRKAALQLVESLGAGGAVFLEVVRDRGGLEEDEELRDVLARLIERLGSQPGSGPQPGSNPAR